MENENTQLTKEQMSQIKAELLKEYKSLEEPLEYAEDDFEAEIIQSKRDELASKIRELGAKIRDMDA